jgi:hypothetical protein
VKKLAEATHKAKADTARFMTMQLRQHALSYGWDAEVANNLSVVHENGNFHAKVHPDHTDRAFVHEYGNEHTRPTAAIRKFMSDPTNANNAFMVSVNRHWEKMNDVSPF